MKQFRSTPIYMYVYIHIQLPRMRAQCSSCERLHPWAWRLWDLPAGLALWGRIDFSVIVFLSLIYNISIILLEHIQEYFHKI